MDKYQALKNIQINKKIKIHRNQKNDNTQNKMTGISDGNMCIVCYSNENYNLGCLNKTCYMKICEECFESYLKMCLESNNLVKCLNQNCKSHIISSSFNKNVKTNHYDLYKKVLVNAFVNKNREEVQHILSKNEMIEKMRIERKRFIKTFPPAVKLMIDVSLTKKMAEIDKKNGKYFSELAKQTHRKCLINHCKGKMNEKYECILCESKFCEKCENLLGYDHVCKNEDIKSLETIADIQKCPNCKVRIERSGGCDSMKCTVCGTYFNYSNGEVGGHGSSNIMTPLRTYHALFEFKDKYISAISKKLTKIENNEPKEPSEVIMNNTIGKIIIEEEKRENKGEENEENEENDNKETIISDKVVKIFENYLKEKNKCVNFVSTVLQINDLHSKEMLTAAKLDDIINENGWYQ